jgi:hypothetical protein
MDTHWLRPVLGSAESKPAAMDFYGHVEEN